MKLIAANEPANDRPFDVSKNFTGGNSSAGIRAYISICLLTITATSLLLYLLNYLIAAIYKPDSAAMLARIVPTTILPPGDFHPEPVERLQFQLSLLCMPLFVLITYLAFKKLTTLLVQNIKLAASINIAALFVFLAFLTQMLSTKVLYVDGTNADMFQKNLVYYTNPIVILVFYSVAAYVLIVNVRSEPMYKNPLIPKAMMIVGYLAVAMAVYEVFLCNIFYLPAQPYVTLFETNPLFYSVTQVYAGKSLLVDVSSQYGLFPLFLLPVFKIIGLGTYKFGLIMAFLNAATFILLYLGIRKVIRQPVISLIVFFAVIYWSYWYVRLPLEGATRYYYQYSPIRTIFPALVFYLFACYQQADAHRKRVLLPLLAISASLSILWNTDSGAPAFGAALAALLYSGTGGGSVKLWIKKSMRPALWMFGSFIAVLLLFMLVTKLRSNSWPHFSRFLAYQQLYYISGFYMLPMAALHLWNLPALVYISACTFCAYYLRKPKNPDVNTVAFLFVLGCGIFAYFQGRSHESNLYFVIYPAVICSGIFCSKLLARVEMQNPRKIKMNEIVVFFFVPFLFIADAAFSMFTYMPAIYTFGTRNAYAKNDTPNIENNKKIDFVTQVLPVGDTTIILSVYNESYIYAKGKYYNPVNVPGSTELATLVDFNTLVDSLKNTRHPIVFDQYHQINYVNSPTNHSSDTIIYALAEHTHVDTASADGAMIILRHGKDHQNMLKPDANTIFYNDYGSLAKYLPAKTKITLPESFTVEMIVHRNAAISPKNSCVAGNETKADAFKGMDIVQSGSNDDDYGVIFGSGNTWMKGSSFTLRANQTSDVVIIVNKNKVITTVNGSPVDTVILPLPIKNSEDPFFFSGQFAGTVYELKIERM